MKKLLALVLALVMTLGLATVSTSAAYSDADDIEYTEAVDVMTAVGVFQGKGDAFAPNDNLNRAEAAKLIAYLMLGNKTAESMVGSGTRFTDVPASHWAAGFIEYLASVGIVSGVGNNQFNPNGQVTGVQFAKMLLVALGYDAEIEKFVGDGWSINIQKVANQNDLFKGLDISANDALTRQQAAQMCLNDLKADMVEYADKGTTVNVGGATVTTGVKNAEEKVEKGSNNFNGAAVGDSDRIYRQLAEELYGNDLKLDDNGSDSFGRPTNKWTYKNVEVGEYSNKSNLLETYTAKFSKKNLYDLLGKDQYDNIKDGKTTLNLWVDGVKTTYSTSANISTVMDRSDTGALNNSGNGTLTQVYLDDDNDIVDVVSVQTYVWQVTADYSESRGDITIKSVGDDKGESDTTKRINPINLKDRTLKDDDFEEIKDLKKDDYVLITASRSTSTAAYEVESIAKAELKSGKVTTFTEADTVTIDGEKLKYSKMVPVNGDHKKATYTVGETASLVMDAYGYVIAVDEAVVNDNYVFISNIAATSGLNTQSEADAYFTDGSNEALKINKLLGSDSKSAILGTAGKVIASTGETASVGAFGDTSSNTTSSNAGWYTYSKTSGDKYNLSAIGSSYAQVGYTYTAKGGANADVVKNDQVYFLKSAAYGPAAIAKTTLSRMASTAPAYNTLKANNDTIFVVEQDGDVNVYTGVKNAPGVTLNRRSAGDYDQAVIVAVYDTSNMYAKYVYITLTPKADLDGGNNTELFYVLKNDTKNWIDEQNSYAMWYVINSEGKAELVKTDYDFAPTSNYRGYYKVFKNSDGDYSKASTITTTNSATIATAAGNSHYIEATGVTVGPRASTTAAWNDADAISYSNGSLVIGQQGFSVTDDTKIVLVQSKSLSTTLMNNPDLNYEIEVLTGDELEQKFNDCTDYTYNIQGRVGGNYPGDTDLKEIYVTVTGATAPSKATTAAASTDLKYVGVDNTGSNWTLYYYVEANVTPSVEDVIALFAQAGYTAAYGASTAGTYDITTPNGTLMKNITVGTQRVVKVTKVAASGGSTTETYGWFKYNTAFGGNQISTGYTADTGDTNLTMGATAYFAAASSKPTTITTTGANLGAATATDNVTIYDGGTTAATFQNIVDAISTLTFNTNVTVLTGDVTIKNTVKVANSATLAFTSDLTITGSVELATGSTLKAANITLKDGSTVAGGTVTATTNMIVGCTVDVKVLNATNLILQAKDEDSSVTIATAATVTNVYLGYSDTTTPSAGTKAATLVLPANSTNNLTGTTNVAGKAEIANATTISTLKAAAGSEVSLVAESEKTTTVTKLEAAGACDIAGEGNIELKDVEAKSATAAVTVSGAAVEKTSGDGAANVKAAAGEALAVGASIKAKIPTVSAAPSVGRVKDSATTELDANGDKDVFMNSVITADTSKAYWSEDGKYIVVDVAVTGEYPSTNKQGKLPMHYNSQNTAACWAGIGITPVEGSTVKFAASNVIGSGSYTKATTIGGESSGDAVTAYDSAYWKLDKDNTGWLAIELTVDGAEKTVVYNITFSGITLDKENTIGTADELNLWLETGKTTAPETDTNKEIAADKG